MPTDTQRAPSDLGFPEATVQDYETAGEDVRERLLEHRKAVRGLERSGSPGSTQYWVDEFLRTEHALIIAIAKRVREGEGVKLDGPECVAVANLLHRALNSTTAASTDHTLWDSAWKKIIAYGNRKEASHA